MALRTWIPFLTLLPLSLVLLGGTPVSYRAPLAQASSAEHVAQAQTLSRLERWTGSYNGCMGGATPEERAQAVSLEYSCACLATFIVNLCAPHDMTTNEEVMACFETSQMSVQNAFSTCLQYGPLQVSI